MLLALRVQGKLAAVAFIYSYTGVQLYWSLHFFRGVYVILVVEFFITLSKSVSYTYIKSQDNYYIKTP